MKIYFFGADYPPTGGGIATYSSEQMHAFSQNKEVSLIKALIFNNKDPRKEEPWQNVEVKTLSKIGFFYVGIKVFIEFWKSGDFNIFNSLNLFPVGFWVVVWSKVFRKKTIVTFYGTDANDTSASGKTGFLKKWTLKNASMAVTISNFTKQITEKKYNLKDERIKVIYPVVPKIHISNDNSINNIKEVYGINDDTFVIVSVCRLVKRKGVEFLIKAVKQMNDNNIKLFVIGDGPEKENLIKLVDDLKLKDRVSILGKVEDTVPFYKIANVATLVSFSMDNEGDFEGLGLVLLEAQSYGVPVIGSRSGGIPEAFDDGVTGLVVEPKDVKGLAQALLKLKNNKQLSESFSKNTVEFLDSRFGIKNTIDRYIELCRSL